MSLSISRPPVLWHDTLDSTSEEARRQIVSGRTSAVWIATETQTAGRGRSGRSWASPRGNLFASLAIPYEGGPATAMKWPFAVGVGVADALSALKLIAPVNLKWPNDLRSGGRKLGGILVETLKHAGVDWAVVGIGINVSEAPEGTGQPTTCLHALGAPAALGPQDVLDMVSLSLAGLIPVDQERFGELLERWMRRAEGVGSRFVAKPGGVPVEGIFEGLEPDGGLRLRLDDGALHVVRAGEVELVKEIR